MLGWLCTVTVTYCRIYQNVVEDWWYTKHRVPPFCYHILMSSVIQNRVDIQQYENHVINK